MKNIQTSDLKSQDISDHSIFVALRRVYRLALIIGLIVVGLALSFWLQLLLWTSPNDQVRMPVNQLRMNLKQWWLELLCRTMGLKIHRKGGPWTGPVFMISNHISWLDIPILGANVPFHFLAKSEIRNWPIIGWLAHVTGTLFIRRRSGDSTKVTQQLTRHLSQGNSILVFPEGTTSNGQQVLPFHKRLFQSAIDSDVAIQPITLGYCEAGRPHPEAPFINDDELVPHIWNLLGKKEIHVHLQYHPPLKAKGVGIDAKQLARNAQAIIEKGLESIFPLMHTPEEEAHEEPELAAGMMVTKY